jgi:hypothetical protein
VHIQDFLFGEGSFFIVLDLPCADVVSQGAMSFTTFPARPSRARADLPKTIAPYVSHVMDPDWPVRNPWIQPALVPIGEPADERQWEAIERTPSVSAAIRARKARLLGDGVVLEPGEGDGAEELHEWWSWVLQELPLTAILDTALRSVARGWQPFENVGAFREMDGRRYFIPVKVEDALSWHFSWTGRGDLIFCPGGTIEAKGYRRRALPAQMKWWTPRCGVVKNPYGRPMHYDYLARSWAYVELCDAGFAAIKQSQGFLKIAHDLGLGQAITEGDRVKIEETRAYLLEIIAELQASGILLAPIEWDADWVALTSALDGWIKLWRWFDDGASSYYSGGNLQSMVSGNTGSRAVGEVQERLALALAAGDGACIEHEFRAGLLRPWTAFNASIIAPQIFPGTGITPRAEDIPLAVLPRLSFKALHRIGPDALELLRTFADIGVVDGEVENDDEGEERQVLTGARVDVDHHLDLAGWRLLAEDDVSSFLDLAKTDPPPMVTPAAAAGGQLPEDSEGPAEAIDEDG